MGLFVRFVKPILIATWQKQQKEQRTCQNELKRNFKQGVAWKVLLTDITKYPDY